MLRVRVTLHSGRWDGRVLKGRFRPEADIGDRLPICHPATILRSLATPIKPNPPKDGDGKPRVLASSEKPRNDSPKDPKIAELP